MQDELEFYLRLPAWSFDQARLLLIGCNPQKSKYLNPKNNHLVRFGDKFPSLVSNPKSRQLIEKLEKINLVRNAEKPFQYTRPPEEWLDWAEQYGFAPDWKNDAADWFPVRRSTELECRAGIEKKEKGSVLNEQEKTLYSKFFLLWRSPTMTMIQMPREIGQLA